MADEGGVRGRTKGGGSLRRGISAVRVSILCSRENFAIRNDEVVPILKVWRFLDV